MNPLLPTLALLLPLTLHAATDQALLDQLSTAGMSPRTNDSGDLIAIYKFAPDGQLPVETWEALRTEKHLKTLNGMRLQSRDLEQLGKLEQIEELIIGGGSKFDEADLAHLAAMPNLRYLNFHHIRDWEGDGFEHFEGNESVETLKLHNLRPFKGGAYPHIAKMEGLKEIEITANIHGFEALEPLRGHPSLEALIYPVKGETMDAFLEFSTSLPHLKEFLLLLPSGELTPLTQGQVSLLASLPHLERLRAINLGMTQAQAETLEAARPGLEISLRKKEETHGDSVPMEPLP